MRKVLKLTVLCLSLVLAHYLSKAQKNRPLYVPGELIVKFKDNNNSAKTNQFATKMQAKVVETSPDLGVELWKIDERNAKLDVRELIEQHKNHPDIEYIEPNYLYSLNGTETTEDPNSLKQWGLHNTGEEVNGNTAVEDADIDAPEGWEIQSESPSIVVGILDTGIDWRNPNLIDNIWQNLDEDRDGDGRVLEYDTLKGRWVFDPDDVNGKDNNYNSPDSCNGNGYIDDFIGWNFVNNNNQPFFYYGFNNGYYTQSHGTHVAGIIGGAGDEQGIMGVTRSVQLASLKIFPDERQPNATAWKVSKAIEYASTMGMQISSNSWGGAYDSQTVERAILKAAENNHIFIASAGNGDDQNIGYNNPYYYPAGFDFDNIIAVANTDYTDQLSQSSNYNIYKIDIAAPGTEIYSCLPYSTGSNKPSYGYRSGTSMAVPMVAGACALVWEKAMEEFSEDSIEVKVAHIKNFILENVDELPQLKGKIATGGRLNIHKALSAVIDTTYTNQYLDCRKRDSLTLSIVYDALGLETFNPVEKDGSSTIDYYDTWGYDNKPMNEWWGVTLNSLGCVSELKIDYNRDIKPQLKQPRIPAAIGQLSELTVLSLGGGSYGFSDLERSSDYFDIDINAYEAIDENEFNISIPPEIFNLKKLRSLNLGGNKFSGSIPAEIAQLENLEYLNLSINGLTGSIPPELFDLIKLKEINLSFNQLDGALPNSFKQLENLESLQLVYNNLSGNIPGAIGNMPLNLIDLGYNNFDSHIPDVFKHQQLRYLYLNNNSLSGPIAPSLSRLSGLSEIGGLDLSYNNLSGCYDPALIKMGSWMYDEEDYNQLWASEFSNQHISDGNNFETTWEDFVNTKNGSCWASATTKVWPGDMNNDGRIAMDDIVYYRIATGNEGPPRRNEGMEYEETVSWEGKLGLDWPVQVYGVNGKHQDANGDSLVNSLDYQVIVDNMGKVNPDHYEVYELKYYANGIEMILRLIKEESTYNEKVFELQLNDEGGGGAANFHTLSAEMKFNRKVDTAYMEFISNCIVDSLSEKKFDEETKNLSYAISKSDLTECGNVLAKIVAVVHEEVIDEGGKFLRFKINSINSQTGVSINETVGTSGINSLSIDSEEELFIQVNAAPERCENGGTATAEVIGGQPPYTYHWESNSDSFWGTAITTNSTITELVAGIYTLTVIDDNETEQSLSFEVGSAIVLEYDENGNSIDCKIQVDESCPDELNLTDVIQQDTYKAAYYIHTDGTITGEEEVELKAGEHIQLAPGFKMENNTSLRLILDDCEGDE